MKSKKMMLAGIAAATVTVSAAIGVPLANATSGTTGTSYSFNGTSVNIRTAPNTSGDVVGSLYDGDVKDINCWTQGESATNPRGDQTDVWFQIDEGYVSGAFFFQDDPDVTVPQCEDAGDGAAPPTDGTVDTSSEQAFLDSIAPLAQESQRQHGVPASVAMAQAIIESGWGTSELTTQGNAYFGIKCNGESQYSTGCVTMGTWEHIDGEDISIDDAFRTYPDAASSFLDHGDFLSSLPRYAPAFDYTDDPDQFIRKVHEGGYATDPSYSDKIINKMVKYDLYQYDL